MRWLSEKDVKVGKVALVAPFLDPDHDEVKSDFFRFALDTKISSKTKGLHIFYSTDDDREITESVDQIKVLPNVEITALTGKGHLTYGDMKTEEFPELVNWLIK